MGKNVTATIQIHLEDSDYEPYVEDGMEPEDALHQGLQDLIGHTGAQVVEVEEG